MRFAEKVVIATGALAGLGRGAAHRLAVEGAAIEYGIHGVRVNAIAPGVIMTSLVNGVVVAIDGGQPEAY